MSPERSEAESKPNKNRYEIVLDTSFKPFERMRWFFWPKKGETPFFVPEDYDYVLTLRKNIRFRGMDGYIDIIEEDPLQSMAIALISQGSVETPMGDVTNRLTLSRKENSAVVDEAPQIIRVSFLAKTPSDYSKLLQTYVDVRCGQENYLMTWNICRPCVKKRIKFLEDGNELLVTEKNLFNKNSLDTEPVYPEPGDIEDQEVGHVGIVWLPRDLKKLKTIEFTFRKLDSDGNLDMNTDPNPSIQKHEPVLV